MSSYKILVSKNEVARLTDANITYEDSGGTADVDVTFFVNDEEIFTRTLTDEGCWLTWDGTLGEGFHTIKVVPEAGKPTDIRIDKVLIDDHTVVGSQYLMDTRIFGKEDDYFKYKCCAPWHAPKSNDYVWWGDVYNADYTVKANTTWYRPHVVTDLGEWWEWTFSITANGHIHWTVDDSDSILYDSTQNYIYYAAKSTLANDSTFPYPDYDWVGGQLTADSTGDTYWQGAGTYKGETMQMVEFTEDWEDYNHTVFYQQSDWYDAHWYYFNYYRKNDVEPIQVS